MSDFYCTIIVAQRNYAGNIVVKLAENMKIICYQ